MDPYWRAVLGRDLKDAADAVGRLADVIGAHAPDLAQRVREGLKLIDAVWKEMQATNDRGE